MAIEELQDRSKDWYGFDLDKVLARQDEWLGVEHIGEPIPLMIERIQDYIRAGKRVKIFTARVSEVDQEVSIATIVKIIDEWSVRNIGQIVPVTCEKDRYMQYCYDDRSRQVIENTGVVVGEYRSSQ